MNLVEIINKKISSLKKITIKDFIASIVISVISISIVTTLHFFGAFDFLELKMYDFKFAIRGPLSATGENNSWPLAEKFTDNNKNGKWDANEEFVDLNNNKVRDKGLDVAIVYSDDETYKFLSEKYSYPYPRGKVWAKAIENLTLLGAKVIVLDYIFDAPDLNTTRSKIVRDDLVGINDLYDINPQKKDSLQALYSIDDNDETLAEAIFNAKQEGVSVILSGKIEYDPNSTSPYSVLPPSKTISSENLTDVDFGMVDIQLDKDGFLRGYPIYQKLPDTEKFNYSLAVETVLKYYDIDSDEAIPIYNENTRELTIGDSLIIPTNGGKNSFLLNYYGPSSKALGASGTFSNYPLKQILDDETICFDELIWDEDFEEYICPDNSMTDDDWVDNMYYASFVTKQKVFENKIVILGTSLAEEQDYKNVPLMEIESGKVLMPGVDVHANAIQQLLHQSYIKSPYNELNINSGNATKHIILIFFVTIITLLIVSALGTYSSTFAMGCLVLFWFNYSVGAFVDNQAWIFRYIFGNWDSVVVTLKGSSIVPTVFPIVSIILPYGLNLSYKLYTEGKNKKFLKETFGTFVSPKLVDQMYETKQTPQLGGIDVYNTCFFSDIASFSSFSEKMTAPELVELLNEYLEEMTNILLDNGGTLDKYIGDAIIAIFGSPIELKDHEYKGALAICRMNDKLQELRQKWKSEGDKWPEVVHNMRHRIGLNTGQIVAGNMGSSVRMSYTMMGDAVNTTARLESGAKQYGIESQVGEKIYEATKDQFVYRHLDHVRVKGKKNPVKTFELISEKGKEPDSYTKLLPLWDKAVKLYKEQKWDEAIKLFEECDKLEEEYIGRPTTPSLFFIARCNEFKSDPPGDNWDGIYTLKSK